MYRYDGRRWMQIAAPPFTVEAMHGLDEDHLWVAGTTGRVAHWARGSWRVFDTGVIQTLIDVHVAAPNEYYAVSNVGSVLEGSDFGWTRIGTVEGALVGYVQCVAKWGGDLWVGASRLGLFRRVGVTHRFERLKPKVTAVSFDTRGSSLLIGCDQMIATTDNGQNFRGVAQDVVSQRRAGRELGDF